MKHQKVIVSIDLTLFTPEIFTDQRGYFLERFNKKIFHQAAGYELDLFQQNESLSSKGIVRGLHYQLNNTQGKLVSVIEGSIIDVAVDIRENSKTFGEHFVVPLDGKAKQLLWIPKGYAHGFSVISDQAIISYLVDSPYDQESEQTIIWSDPALGINWGLEEPVVSQKDSEGKLFKDAYYL